MFNYVFKTSLKNIELSEICIEKFKSIYYYKIYDIIEYFFKINFGVPTISDVLL